MRGRRQRGCQATRGLGDLVERELCHTSDQASWMAFEILPDEEVVQLVTSDGVGDVACRQELAKHLAAKLATEGRVDGKAVAAEVMKLVKERSRFQPDRNAILRPTHDDCSVAVAHWSANACS